MIGHPLSFQAYALLKDLKRDTKTRFSQSPAWQRAAGELVEEGLARFLPQDGMIEITMADRRHPGIGQDKLVIQPDQLAERQ